MRNTVEEHIEIMKDICETAGIPLTQVGWQGSLFNIDLADDTLKNNTVLVRFGDCMVESQGALFHPPCASIFFEKDGATVIDERHKGLPQWQSKVSLAEPSSIKKLQDDIKRIHKHHLRYKKTH